MKSNSSKTLEVVIASLNFMTISYALSSIMISFKTSWIYILFFASNVWVISEYWKTLKQTTGNKIVASTVLVCSFLVICLVIYFVGYIDGVITPLAN